MEQWTALREKCFLTSYSKANTSSTIEFVKQLQSQNPKAKIVLIWDGASHHRSQEFRDFLARTNQGKEWNVHCLRFCALCTRRKSDRKRLGATQTNVAIALFLVSFILIN